MTSLDVAGREFVAANLLNITLADAHVNQRQLSESDATYFWEAGRGGGSLIVGSDGSILFATSSVPFDAHVAAYEQGRRTDSDAFTSAADT